MKKHMPRIKKIKEKKKKIKIPAKWHKAGFEIVKGISIFIGIVIFLAAGVTCFHYFSELMSSTDVYCLDGYTENNSAYINGTYYIQCDPDVEKETQIIGNQLITTEHKTEGETMILSDEPLSKMDKIIFAIGIVICITGIGIIATKTD